MKKLRKIELNTTKICVVIAIFAAFLPGSALVFAEKPTINPAAKQYIESQAAKAEQQKGQALQRSQSLVGADKKTVNRKEHRWHMGVDKGTEIQNGFEDLFERFIPEFLDCAEFEIVGVCFKIEGGLFGPTIKLAPMIKYHYGVELFEIVKEKGLSAFAPKHLNSSYIPQGEDWEYEKAGENAKLNMLETAESVEAEIEERFPGLDLPNKNASDYEISPKALEKVKEIKDAFSLEDRISLRAGKGGALNLEYHVLPSQASLLFYEFFDQLSAMAGALPIEFKLCHEKIPWWFPYMSEWPWPAGQGGFTPIHLSRVMDASQRITAVGQNRNYAADYAQAMLDPFGCMQDNVPLSTLDEIFPGLENVGNHAGGRGGCWKDKKVYNKLSPVTAKTGDLYETSSSEALAIKALHLAYDMFPPFFYDFDINKDKIEYLEPEVMADKHPCLKVDEGPQSPQQWGDANIDKLEEGSSIHDWILGRKWREFICCPEGYHKLFGPEEKKK